MARYFITGTGTDIGKTWLSCALMHHWRANGVAVHGVKPVMSGVDADRLEHSDAGQLLLAAGKTVTPEAVAMISPWRFSASLSPDMAAAKEGRVIDFGDLVTFSCQSSADARTLTIVEGVGGVMVPLDDRHTVLDWIAAIDAPAVLVAGSYLGAMSHTLTALRALRSAEIRVAAVVLNESPGSTVALDQTVASVRHHCGGVAVIPVCRATPQDGIATLANILRPSQRDL